MKTIFNSCYVYHKRMKIILNPFYAPYTLIISLQLLSHFERRTLAKRDRTNHQTPLEPAARLNATIQPCTKSNIFAARVYSTSPPIAAPSSPLPQSIHSIARSTQTRERKAIHHFRPALEKAARILKIFERADHDDKGEWMICLAADRRASRLAFSDI